MRLINAATYTLIRDIHTYNTWTFSRQVNIVQPQSRISDEIAQTHTILPDTG